MKKMTGFARERNELNILNDTIAFSHVRVRWKYRKVILSTPIIFGKTIQIFIFIIFFNAF